MPLQTQTQSPVQLIVAGFHRSGTSLTMQWLHNAGLTISDDLVSATAANPDGHFEDRRIVRLHDDMLARDGASWHSPEPQKNDYSDYDDDAFTLIAGYPQHQNWGFKDPRTCLFLRWWYEKLTKPKVLLVYRDYLSCYHSLRTRQAQQLAFNPSLNGDQTFFWSDHDRSFRLWLHYNQALLAFAEDHREHVLAVSHRQLLSGFNIIAALNAKFGLELDADAPSGIRFSSGLKNPEPALVKPAEALLHAMDNTLTRLDALSQNPEPYRLSASPSQTARHYSGAVDLLSVLSALNINCQPETVTPPKDEYYNIEKSDCTDTAQNWIRKLNRPCCKPDQVSIVDTVDAALASYPDDVGVLINAGKALIDSGNLQRAEETLLCARKLAPSNKQVLLHLFRAKQKLGKHRQAAVIARAMIALEPQNQSTRVQYAEQLLASGRREAARSLVAAMRHKQPKTGVEGHSYPYFRLLAELADPHEVLSEMDNTHQELQTDYRMLRLKSALLMKTGQRDAARVADAMSVVSRLQQSGSVYRKIENALSSLRDTIHRDAMRRTVCQQLQQLIDESGLEVDDGQASAALKTA